jgi:hypothetical protein
MAHAARHLAPDRKGFIRGNRARATTPPGDSQIIQVYNWINTEEGDLYDDLMAAHKGRSKQDLIKERKKLEPTIGF